MPIKLNDIKNIANIIKKKYGKNLHKMNFIFCFKKDVDSYFIFQEIQGMPIKRVVYHESNNSVSFVASWAAWGVPYDLVADANNEQIESWKELLDRGRPYNAMVHPGTGGFMQDKWTSVDRQNHIEKKKKHKNKSDAFVEFRVDRITRAAFSEWGFELYSPTISMIGFRSRHRFPYSVEGVIQEDDRGAVPSYNRGNVTYDEDDVAIKLSWQGGSFHVPEFENGSEVSQVSQVSTEGYGNMYDLSSYWDSNDSDEENDEFDDEMANYFLEEREDDETILDVGQKEVDLYFED